LNALKKTVDGIKLTRQAELVVPVVGRVVLGRLDDLAIGPVGPVLERPRSIDQILLDELVANVGEAVADAELLCVVINAHIRLVRERVELLEEGAQLLLGHVDHAGHLVSGQRGQIRIAQVTAYLIEYGLALGQQVAYI
jgi:hypothetical protein